MTTTTMPVVPTTTINDTTMPVIYIAARKALSECVRIDECRDWSDRAAAMAVYAKQAKDTTLLRLARRIQARAVRRCGELAKLIEPARGARTDLGRVPARGSRKAAADGAGLSPHQLKQAIRVANVPREEFERQVESEKPPTVTALAAHAQRHRDDGEQQQHGAGEDALLPDSPCRWSAVSPAVRALAAELAGKSKRTKIRQVAQLMQLVGIYDGVMKNAMEEFAKYTAAKLNPATAPNSAPCEPQRAPQ
jgi:hypothetical protein